MPGLSRTPRLWTEDQVDFVLDEIETGKRYKAIATVFNAKYTGIAKINDEQVKYIKAQYKRSSRVSGAPAINPTPAAGSHDGQAMISNESQVENLDASRKTSQESRTSTATSNNMVPAKIPKRPAEEDLAAPPAKLSTQSTPPILSRSQNGEFSPSSRCPAHKSGAHEPFSNPDPFHVSNIVHGVWHNSIHDNCLIAAKHQHLADGGVKFKDLATITELLLVFGPPLRWEIVEHPKDKPSTVTDKTQGSVRSGNSQDWRHDNVASYVVKCSGTNVEGRDTSSATQPASHHVHDVTSLSAKHPHNSIMEPSYQSHSSGYGTEGQFHHPASSTTSGMWRNGQHDGCALTSTHYHHNDGAIRFRSSNDVMRMITDVNGLPVSLEDLAGMLEV